MLELRLGWPQIGEVDEQEALVLTHSVSIKNYNLWPHELGFLYVWLIHYYKYY